MEDMQKLSPERLRELREQLKTEAAMQETPVKKDVTEEPADAYALDNGKYIDVEIAEDKMSASVILGKPDEGETYSVPEVVAALRKSKVVLGFKTQDIMDMLNEMRYEEPIVVATGKEVTPGTEGYFEFMVDLSEHKTPEIREDGTVDYSAMGRLANIREGELVAVYHPAVQGVKGYNVMGAEMLPKLVKDLAPLRGKHIVHDEETGEFRATIDGKISCSNNNVEILTVHEINDDIDLTVGVVEFYGDVVINGNVEAGCLVRAGRNVTINGTVSGAKIFAGGDIVLSKGIQGNGKAKVSARGNVYADFIEYADVEAKGDVKANSVIGSNIVALGDVEIDGTRGVVLGGYTHGLMGVRMRNAGNASEPKTIIHAGYTPEEYEKYAELAKEEKGAKAELEKLVADMSDLLAFVRTKGATPEQKKQIFDLNVKKQKICDRLREIDEDKQLISQTMAKGANSSIIVSGDIFVNTVISIDLATYKIVEQDRYAKFVCRNGIIERRLVPIG